MVMAGEMLGFLEKIKSHTQGPCCETLQLALSACCQVCQSVSLSHFTFSMSLRSVASLFLPKFTMNMAHAQTCATEVHYCPSQIQVTRPFSKFQFGVLIFRNIQDEDALNPRSSNDGRSCSPSTGFLELRNVSHYADGLCHPRQQSLSV